MGLNLTMASRVILIDPWWNSASEQQAFCRVFRIGQKETTFMTRFCVKDTVDAQLIHMQERKQGEIDTVMEDDGDRVKKMTIKDLMRLFGPVKDDDEESGGTTKEKRDNAEKGENHEPDPSPLRREVPVGVVEQRVSNLSQGAMCLVLLTGPFLHVLNLIPKG